MFTKYFIVLIALVYFLPSANCKGKKKYAISWEKVYSCPDFDNSVINVDNLHFYLVSETDLRINGSLVINQVFPDEVYNVVLFCDKSLGGKYIPLLSLTVDNLCEKIKNSASDVYDYMSKLIPPITDCPIQPGSYDLRNIVPNTNGVKLNRQLAGDYKARIEVKKATDNVICYMVDFRITEQE